jgi:Arc/MetJ family transcription regulator
MARTRVSTTVDDELLTRAREMTGAPSDSALLDQALGALLDRHRRAEIDRAYVAYDEHPLEEADDWGDLASFRSAAAAS